MKILCYNILMHYTRAYFGDIMRFFQDTLVESAQKPKRIFAGFDKFGRRWQKQCYSVNFQEWSDSIYDA